MEDVRLTNANGCTGNLSVDFITSSGMSHKTPRDFVVCTKRSGEREGRKNCTARA